MTKWTAPDIASIRGDNSRPLQKIFGSLTEYLNGYTLDSLDDVVITSPTAGQTLSYDAVTSLWNNATFSDGGGLTNLNASNLASGTVPTGRMTGSYTGVTSVGTLGSLNVSGVSSFGEVLATTVLGATNRGIGIKADPTDTQSILQFTNNAVNAQWSSLVATNGLLTVTTPLTVSGTVTATTFSGSGTGITQLGTISPSLTVTGGTGTTITATTQTLINGTNNNAGIYLGGGTGSSSAGGIEASWRDAANPSIAIGVTRDNRGTKTVWEYGNVIYSFISNILRSELNANGLTIVGSISASSGLSAYSITGNSNVGGTGNASYHPSGIYATNTTNWLYGTLLTNGGNIGAATQYVGAVYSNGWFRSSGTTGWYSETYGGGIYMDNVNEVKVYNGKAFYVPSSITSGNQISCASNLNVGGTIVLYAPGISYYGSTVGGGSPNQIGFRWASPYVNCTVDNVISAAAANFSDRRIKTNIQTLTNGIDLVRGLRCVKYNPLDVIGFDEETFEPIIGDLDPYDEMIGFIADEVQEVYANAIHGEGNRIKSIDTVQLLSMAVSAIQDLDQRLQQLETV